MSFNSSNAEPDTVFNGFWPLIMGNMREIGSHV